MAQISECPNCGKKGLVQRGENLFQCLSCDFRRDLSKTEKTTDVLQILVTGFLIVVFFRAFQVFEEPTVPASYPNPNSNPALVTPP